MPLRRTVALLCLLLAVLSLATSAADVALPAPVWLVIGLVVIAALRSREEQSEPRSAHVVSVPSLRAPPLPF